MAFGSSEVAQLAEEMGEDATWVNLGPSQPAHPNLGRSEGATGQIVTTSDGSPTLASATDLGSAAVDKDLLAREGVGAPAAAAAAEAESAAGASFDKSGGKAGGGGRGRGTPLALQLDSERLMLDGRGWVVGGRCVLQRPVQARAELTPELAR